MAAKLSAGATRAHMLTLLLSASAADSVAAVDLQVQVCDVTDTRSHNNSSAGPAIDVRVSGADLAGAQAFRTFLERASDDTGRSLLPAKGPPQEFTTFDAGTCPRCLRRHRTWQRKRGSGRQYRADCLSGSAPMDHPAVTHPGWRKSFLSMGTESHEGR